MNFKLILLWLALAASIGLGTYWTAVYYAPRFVMNQALIKISDRFDARTNFLAHSDPIDAKQRNVVRPSPDLAYSVCLFDFYEASRLKITMPKAADYLSVALYDNDTNNFFHLNDSQVLEDQATILLYAPKAEIAPRALAKVDRYELNAPTQRGLVLFRSVVRNAKDWQRINAEWQLMSCNVLDS